MGVLCDWQIERDVKITPWSPARKRPGLVSYGVSSYGYDFRLGYTFDLFRPYPPGGAANVIDPKNFDPRMLERVNMTPRIHKWHVESGDTKWQCALCKQTCYEPDKFMHPCGKVPDHLLIPPHSFVLAESLETVWFPRDVLVLVVGKSTYARCGLIVNVTPGEPEWEGKWTVELSNTTDLPIKVYPGEGIMQCVFLRSDARYELMLGALMDRLGIDPKPTDPRPIDKSKHEPNGGDSEQTLRDLLFRTGEGFRVATCDQSYADKKGKYQGQEGLTNPTVDSPAPGPTVPPDSADKNKRWQSPDGTVWVYNNSNQVWVQVTYPRDYNPRGGKA